MKKYNAASRTKKVIDMVMGLLFIALLGYSFTGAPFHEVAGIVLVVMVVIHNIINIKWYKAIGKGTYNKKRKIVTAVNFALAADMAAIMLTGIVNSRYLFHTGIHIAGIGQIHTILASVGFVLIASHILVHAFGHAKKRYKMLPVMLMILISVLAVLLDVWLLPYLKRHFLTVEITQETVISGESVELGDRKILTVYFTRVGNTDFDSNVDAVSGASLLLNEKKEFLGNSQVIGLMIQNAAGGDIVSINTKERYPSSYFDTVSVASKEMKRPEQSELVDMPENLDGYDTVFIVFPLWWNTIPKPVEAFLDSYDFSGKSIIPVVTHGGSGTGKSIEAIKDACDGAVSEEPLEIYCGDIPYCRERVTEWLKGL
ncbi:MAG: hypothetical protein K2I03_03980 [Lachnospiraceae bacterium]|nr:hypothetical protein [Lachnospiraceae bacterium]